jgi:hypothetical protein
MVQQTGVMLKGSPNANPSNNSDERVWGVVRRLGEVRKPLVSEAVVMAAPEAGRGRTEPNLSILESIRTPAVGATSAVWILVGTFWISIGMIVSATVVTVAFLA